MTLDTARHAGGSFHALQHIDKTPVFLNDRAGVDGREQLLQPLQNERDCLVQDGCPGIALPFAFLLFLQTRDFSHGSLIRTGLRFRLSLRSRHSRPCLHRLLRKCRAFLQSCHRLQSVPFPKRHHM